jgi:hypothetical protein
VFTGMLLSVFLIALDQTILVRAFPLSRSPWTASAEKTGLSKAPALPVIASKFQALDEIVSGPALPCTWDL